jgi:hypothetical protein
VEVSLPQLKKSTRTDATGAFRITDIAPGEHAVIARFPGFEPLTAAVTFARGQVLEADLVMTPVIAKLDTVEVKDKLVDIRLVDFEERRKLGVGRFLDTQFFEKNKDRQTAIILTGSIPGIHTLGNTDEKFIVSSRPTSNPKKCYVQVVVNGNVMYNGYQGQPEFDINSIQAGDILGVEYYTVAEVPARYNATGGSDPQKVAGPACGTLVVWTK